MSEIERKARELLDLHADPIPVAVEDGRWFMVREQDALDAIVAALSQEVSHKAAALDEFPGLLRALTKVARLDEGESVWIEPSEAKAVIAVLATQQPQGVQELGALKDPNAVHAAMLRGVIAKPSWRAIVDLMGEVPNGEEAQLSRIADLQHQIAELHAGPAAGMPEVLSAHGLRALDNSIRELRSMVEQAKDFDLDEMAVGAFETAIESMEMRKKAAAPSPERQG